MSGCKINTKIILRYLEQSTSIIRVAAFPTRSSVNQKRFNSNLMGLPFKITRDQANEEFANHKRFLEESNGDAKTKYLTIYKADTVKACFVPFHSADVKNLWSSYVGQYGIDYTVSSTSTSTDGNGNVSVSTTTTTYTNWYDCEGSIGNTNYPFGIKETQIYADFSYPRVLIEKVLPTNDVVQISALTKTANGQIVFPHTMNMKLALEKLSARLYDLENSRAVEHIKNTCTSHGHVDRVSISSLDVHMQDAKFNLFSYYIPSYIYESKIGDLANYKIINAYNGEIYGNKIYSIVKSAVFGAGVGGGLTFVASALTRPYILAAQMLVRVVVASVASGAFSAGLARYRNYANNYNFKFTSTSEKEQNAHSFEDKEDIERREFAAKMNKENDYTLKPDHVHFPTDQCKLFGLNPDGEITLEILKNARRKKINTWHPDLFKFKDENSRNKAEAMTQQLNIAYKELEDILQNNSPKK